MTARYKLLNNVIGLIIFLVAAFVYLSTIEPTASFWDCGEYIACSYKLEVGHPPGAPTFLLIGRLFSLFASDPKYVAAAVNSMSALASAGTILFMYWSITMLGRKLIIAMKQELTDGRMYAIMASGIIGAMAYCFSDSFWFSAVEGEVYAMSSFFTALVFWAILKWDADDTPRADRWIVFIAYMIGLSIGVHLLNLLTIPSLVFIVYFKKYPDTNRRGIIIALLVAVGLLGVVQNGIIPGIVSAAANYELFFVNTLGLPFNGGTIIYFLLLAGMIVSGLMYTSRGGKQLFQIFLGITGAFFFFTLLGAAIYGKVILPFLTVCGVAYLIYRFRDNRVVLNTVILSFTVLLIGYSSFFVLVIRSQANTPMDENNPENAISLLAYLQREQYGDWPLLYGQYYNAPLSAENTADDGSPVYGPDKASGEYVVIDARKQTIYNYAPEMCTVFPRMWETQQSSHKKEYESWSDFAHNNTSVMVTDRETGQEKKMKKPTFTGNLRYFFHYQVSWMYLRYFMWNFAGRQNDIQGNSNVTDGNWQSGFPKSNGFEMKKAPQRLRDNKANNNFYMLPLLLGLIGLWFHFNRDWKNAIVVTLMFVFTGLAIVVYLNQYPLQPRERDYAYVGSFYAFAFWIGIGVYALYDLIVQYLKVKQVAAAGMAAVMGATIPFIMGKNGWDDHNRSYRYTCRDFAENYLATCDKGAILFTNGDNDTFPLWYAQEVEGYRTDCRVLNLSLLNTDWYIDQASRKAYDSDRVPFSLTGPKTRQGSCDQVYFDQDLFPRQRGEKPAKEAKPMSARELVDMIKNNKTQAMRVSFSEDDNNEAFPDTLFVLPTNRVYIPVNKAEVKRNGTVPADTPDSLILDRVEWTINKHFLLKSDLMILDLLATNDWKRPIYFAVTAGTDSYLDLDNVQVPDKSPEGYHYSTFFRLEGLAYRLVPMLGNRESFNGQVVCNTDIMFNKMMGVKGSKDFPGYQWGGLEDTTKNIYMDENNLRFTTNQRLQMITLANFLNDEKKYDKAVEVLDRAQKVMPRKFVPYEPLMAYMVDAYYAGKATDKANKLSKDLFDQCEDEFRFYNSEPIHKNSGDAYKGEIGNLERALQMLENSAKKNGQKDLSAAYTARMHALNVKTVSEQQGTAPNGQQFDEATLDSMIKAYQRDSVRSDSAKAAKQIKRTQK